MSAATVSHVYEDRFGEVIDHADDRYLEIRWYDGTEAMSADDFQNWVAAFAGEVEQRHRPGILVDLTRFLMNQDGMDDGWCYEQIVPRYRGGERGEFPHRLLRAARRSAQLARQLDQSPSSVRQGGWGGADTSARRSSVRS